MLQSLCIMGAPLLCISVRNNRLSDCPFVACIKERLALPRPWFKLIVYIAAKSVRIATAPSIFRHQGSIVNGLGRRIAIRLNYLLVQTLQLDRLLPRRG